MSDVFLLSYWKTAAQSFDSSAVKCCRSSLLNSQFLSAFAKLQKANISLVCSGSPSVRPSTRNNSAPTGENFFFLNSMQGLFFNLYPANVENMVSSEQC